MSLESPEPKPTIREIFLQALEMPSAAQREAYLRQVCGNDTGLRAKVDALLENQQDDSFLERPAVECSGTMVVSPAPLEGPGTVIGNYKLLEKLGEGGFGVVYMAEQKQPVRRRVALKIIKVGMDTREVVARFEAERQALAIMDHPSIAKVFDAGATETALTPAHSHPMGEGAPGVAPASGSPLPSAGPGSPLPSDGRGIKGEGHSPLCTPHSALPSGRPYFVMELVRGIKITDYCDQKSLPTRERLDLFIQVCQAVQHAHQKGVIHRDLKPSNILVTVNDGVAVPKVIDFGIAKATQMELTQKTVFTRFHQFIGTPAYMSPEQAEITSVDVDTRSDIYSLGVLLYELLTGKTPFDAKELLQAGLDEMRRTIREKEPARPSTRISTLGASELTTTAKRRGIEAPKLVNVLRGDLDWIVMKCLEKDRARRYETANGLASDIQRHLSNEPVVACPPSNLYRFRKLVRRNKATVSAGVAIAATLVLGFAVATWMFFRETAARKRAVLAEQQQVGLRTEAEAEKTKAQQIAQFLSDMLEGAGPEVAKGRDATILLEILDKTSSHISQELTNQPQVQADLQDILGRVYLSLGQYKKAEQLSRRSLEFRKNSHSDGRPETMTSLDVLAQSLQCQAKFAEAEALFSEVLAMKKKFGERDRDLVAALANLASMLIDERKFSQAEPLVRESLSLAQELHESEVGSLSKLASLEFARGETTQAELDLRKAISILRKQGDDSTVLATLLSNLGVFLEDQRKLAEAETVHREALELQRKLLGDNHPDVAHALANLSYVLGGLRRWEEAERLGQEALEIRRRVFGNEHPHVGNSLNNLADLLARQGKLAEAESMAREALIILKKGLDPHAAYCVCNLASILIRQHKLDEAEQLCSEWLAIGAYAESPLLLVRRGELFASRGRWREAAADLTRARALRPADHLIWHSLAAVLVKQGDLEAYREHCRNSVERFKGTADVREAHRIAKDCLILPSSGIEPETIAVMVTTSLSATNDPSLFGPLLSTKGLAEYRQGLFPDAVQWSEKVLSRQGETNVAWVRVETYAALAMAKWQLGQSDSARAALAKANEIAVAELPAAEASELGDAWLDWIISHALLREARELIEGQAPDGVVLRKGTLPAAADNHPKSE